jgi:thiol-disulfide isomerase/thioredoxin
MHASFRYLAVVVLLCVPAVPYVAFAQASSPLPEPGEVQAGSEHGRIGDWFALRTLDGEVMSFSELSGRVLFVNFWATWCAPCVQEMPTIVDLAESLEDVDVTFLLISIDENVRDVRRFVAAHGMDRFVFLRGWEAGESIFPAGIVPATFVVDRSGTIAYQHHGAADWSSDPIRRLLAEKASAD